MVISVIIPTLNEEVNLPVTLRQLTDHVDVELIVVDGGSSDHTVEIAQRFTPYVFQAFPGRAQQMNIGARHATGDILLFLHADTFLLPGALDEIQRRIIGDGAVGGRLISISIPAVASVNSSPGWPAVGRGGHICHTAIRCFCVATGLRSARRIPEIAIMEDIAFARRLRRAGRLTFIRSGWSPADGAGTPMVWCEPHW